MFGCRQKYLESTEAVKRSMEPAEETLQIPATEGIQHDSGILNNDNAKDSKPKSRSNSTSDSKFLSVSDTEWDSTGLPKSTSFQDAQIASVAQLLDVVRDLEKAHSAFEKIETERERNSLQSSMGGDSTPKRLSSHKAQLYADLQEETALAES